MSIIEQAANRLEALARGAGIASPKQAYLEVPASAPASANAAALAADGREGLPGWRFEGRTTKPVTEQGERELRPRREVSLDLVELERAGYLVPSNTRSPMAQQLRTIKRPLLKNARNRQRVAERLSLIMVTSALPGEGKTYTSINLAMSIATEIDTSVLLIDADVARRGASTRLGVKADVGLLDLLSDASVQLEDATFSTNVPKLSVMAGGHRNELSTELFASRAMDDLLHRLASEFPRLVVVIDASPLLLTSEVKELAPRIGQVVMVVEAGRTQRAAVGHAFAALEHCPIVLSVLNKMRTETPGSDDGYGYGYGYY